jgi:predicted nucleic acid-binding protein
LTATILVDTGILYAMADIDDAWHESVKAFLLDTTDTLFVPITVLPEICYLLNTHLSRESERKLIASIIQGELKIEGLRNEDFSRSHQLLESYSDMNIGFVDASVVAIAERLKIHRILTTDRKHFSVIRPRHCQTFDLLP